MGTKCDIALLTFVSFSDDYRSLLKSPRFLTNAYPKEHIVLQRHTIGVEKLKDYEPRYQISYSKQLYAQSFYIPDPSLHSEIN